MTPGRSLSRICVPQRGTISVGCRTPLSCCLQSSDQHDPFSPASQSADECNASASDTRSQQEGSAKVVLHCAVSHLRPTAQHNQCRMTNTLVCCLQSSDERDRWCSALQAPDERDVSATDTSQGGERQSDEDSAAANANSEESKESEEERSQEYNEAAGLFVRLAKDECKNLQARERLLWDTLRRAKSDRWSELCSGVVVSDGMTEHVPDYARLVLGDDGDMGSCLVARFAYDLRKTHHVTITVGPGKSPVLSCARRSTRNIMNPWLAGRMGQNLLAIVRAIFYNRQRLPHRVALNPNHSEQWKSVVGNRFLLNQINAKTPTVQRSIRR